MRKDSAYMELARVVARVLADRWMARAKSHLARQRRRARSGGGRRSRKASAKNSTKTCDADGRCMRNHYNVRERWKDSDTELRPLRALVSGMLGEP